MPQSSNVMPCPAYPHPATQSLDGHLGAPGCALVVKVVTPVQPMDQSVGKYDLSSDVELVLGAQKRVGAGFQGDGHFERIFQGQRSVLQVRHSDDVIIT